MTKYGILHGIVLYAPDGVMTIHRDMSRKKIFSLIGLFGVVGVLVLLFANSTILSYGSRIIGDGDHMEEKPIAIIFGGGMKEDGTMSDMLEDRVNAGIALYQANTVERLLMTGDDGGWRFDEVHAMYDAAVAAGVPRDAVAIDPHGYNTYRSCYRAKHEFGVHGAIAVSQRFHLYRILYFCQSFGIDTIGYPADDGPYGFIGTVRTMWIREILARLKGWWQVEVTRPVY